jgi:outer membrane protein TolC
MKTISNARILPILVLALFAESGFMSAESGSDDSLTVNTAVRTVLATNLTIQQAMHAVDASSARVSASKSSLYPEAGISLNYARIGPVAAFSFPGFGNLSLFPMDNYDEHLGASATLFDFNKRQKGIELAEAQVQNVKDRLNLTRQGLAYQTIQTFYTILFLRQSIQVQDDEITTLNEHLATTRMRVETGSATDFDALTTEVRVAAADNQKIGLANSLSSNEIGLRRLLGLPHDSPLKLSGRFTEIPVSLNLDSLEAAALHNRIEMKAADDQIAVAQAQYQVASTIDNPSLNVALTYGFKNGYEPNIYAMRGNVAAAVQIQMPLSGVVPFFGGYRGSSMQEEATATSKGAESYKNLLTQQIAADVQKAVTDLRTALDKLQTADITVQQAESALSMAKARYSAGTVTNLDLLDAETALAQAKLMRLETLYRFVIGRYELDAAEGTESW